MNTPTPNVSDQDAVTQAVVMEGVTAMDRLVGLLFIAAGCGAFYWLGTGNLGLAFGASSITSGLLLIAGKFKNQPESTEVPSVQD